MYKWHARVALFDVFDFLLQQVRLQFSLLFSQYCHNFKDQNLVLRNWGYMTLYLPSRGLRHAYVCSSPLLPLETPLFCLVFSIPALFFPKHPHSSRKPLATLLSVWSCLSQPSSSIFSQDVPTGTPSQTSAPWACCTAPVPGLPRDWWTSYCFSQFTPLFWWSTYIFACLKIFLWGLSRRYPAT